MRRLLMLGLLAALLSVACARRPMAIHSADDGRCPLELDEAESEADNG